MKYREKDYGKLIKNNGFQTTNYIYEILVLSKYLKHVENMKKKDHIEFVYDLCKKSFAEFNEVLHGNMVDRAISKGRKESSKPIQIDSLRLYNSELKFFYDDRLDDNDKRILLALLVYKKIANEQNKIIKNDNEVNISSFFKGTRKTLSHIKTMACVKGKYDISVGFGKLERLGYITSTYDARFHLNFIDEISSDGEYYELSHLNFENCGFYYDFIVSGDAIQCEICGLLTRKKSKKTTSQRYCNDCSREIRREKVRINVEKYRNK